MGILKKLGTGQGYLKAGFQGFASSGKTYTATSLAIGVRNHMGLKGPIAFFDTEGGSVYVKERIQAATGMEAVGTRSRAFVDLMETVSECEKEGISVLIVDSITHVWEEVQKAHMARVNENIKRRSGGRAPARHRLEFQDWGPIKQQWGEWTTAFLNSKLHIIFCGRAGFTYDHEMNDETGKKELVKTGTKMKAENEFGYEPSLLIEMEGIKERGKKGVAVHRATILKDRWDVINGQEFDDPTFEAFLPHVSRLTPGAHAPIDTAVKTTPIIDIEGHDDRKRREILVEELDNELTKAFPTNTAEAKVKRIHLLEQVFGTSSKVKIESMGADQLRSGLDKVKAHFAPPPIMDDAIPFEPEAVSQ